MQTVLHSKFLGVWLFRLLMGHIHGVLCCFYRLVLPVEVTYPLRSFSFSLKRLDVKRMYCVS